MLLKKATKPGIAQIPISAKITTFKRFLMLRPNWRASGNTTHEVSLLSSLPLGTFSVRMLCAHSNCKQLNGNFAFSHEDGRFYTIICSLGQLSFSSKMKMFHIFHDEVNCTYTTKISILVTRHAFIILDSFSKFI